MDWIYSLLTILAGLTLRLALPIAATLLAVRFLRRLDAHWQAEAGQMPWPALQKPECWRINDCRPELRRICPAIKSDQACWQVFRMPNGYLRAKCLDCTVFLRAPVHELHQQTI
jgi:hypothetical protein